MPLATRHDTGDPGAVTVADPGAPRKDKPDATPPALRRRLADFRGQLRALDSETSAYLEDKTKDGRMLTDEEFRHLEAYNPKKLPLVNAIAACERELESAERWSIVDNPDNSRAVDRRRGDLMPHEDPANTRNGRHQYSMKRAILAVGWPQDYPLKGLELETHQEMNKQRRNNGLNSASGVLIPMDLPVDLDASLRFAQRSGLNHRNPMMAMEMAQARRALMQQRALDTTAGAGSIPTIVDTTMIELLRPRMVTANMGARIMTDMQGLFAIPRQSSASTFYMVTQGGSVTASNQTIDQVPFSPHTGGAYTTYTRQFLEQTNQDSEQFVREDQSAQVARGVETAALNGQAALGWPMGLLQNPQIGVYPLGTNGTAPTWTQLISMISYVAYYNADVGSLSFVCDALTRGTLQLTLKISASTFPIYLWNTEAPDFPVAGHPCPVTNLLPQNISKGNASNLHAMIFGNWQDLIYAFWSGLDVIVDPYTAAAQGAVNIVALQDFDVNVRHPQSFANCVDIISSITAPTT
jgi:HK97 family phage major capsid protein